MPHPSPTVNKALALLKKQKDITHKAFQTFADIYFKQIPERELNHALPEDLAQHVQQVFQFIEKRRGNERKLKIHNPKYTPHTIINIVNVDQPFLVDTVWLHLQRHNVGVHHSFHPVLFVKRDEKGALLDVSQEDGKGTDWQQESLIHVEIDRQTDATSQAKIKSDLNFALGEAKQVVADFPAMKKNLEQAINHVQESYPKHPNLEENLKFLKWLQQDHFIFLGYRYYKISQTKKPTIKAQEKTGLGLLHATSETLSQQKEIDELPRNLQKYIKDKNFLTITKTLNKSPVHRYVDMDYISVREADSKGKVVGEHRFIGLLTSRAYTSPINTIPIVRQKIEKVLNSVEDLPRTSHNYKSLVNILEMYPREELFHIDEENLKRIAMGIVHLQERRHVRLFMYRAASERQVSVFVFLPLERMNSKQRLRIQEVLMHALDGESLDFKVSMGDDNSLARLFFKIRPKTDTPTKISEKQLEELVQAVAMGWLDNLRHLLIELHGEDKGLVMYRKYEPNFSLSYQEHTLITLAARDVLLFEKMENTNDVQFTFRYREDEKPRLRVFSKAHALRLSSIMPLFENMGIIVETEHTYKLGLADGTPVWLHDFELRSDEALSCANADTLTEALSLIWSGRLENDKFNSLIITGGLDIRRVIIIRALAAYARQISPQYAKADIQKAVLNNPAIATHVADLFDARFSLQLSRKQSQEYQDGLREKIADSLKGVASLDEDRILQKLEDVVLAAVRTNAWQRDNVTDPLAIKIESAKIPGLVKPVPWREIFVYSAELEGVHLRGGAVARGGLRWSDRPADFRTEVLGLMKAQMTKNVVIVPVGAKGGFIAKKLPTGDRATVMAAVEQVYRKFIRSLLSVTDNRIAGKVVPPRDVLSYDKLDSYLVVAADKGTATFSDIANDEAIKADYWQLPKGMKKAPGFWLGDAFASGGSQGYDHKGMGITARGAWESVKHHFLQLGKDIQKEDFTTVGIGDMSGDVFGNGMLLSKHIQLIGAFNHLHIFVDPNPDSAKSFKERQRLFNKPHSLWTDYDPKVLSKGGKIYDRSAKELTLTKEIKARLGTKKDVMTPNELIKELLLLDVELLWNGGIGTYVKAVHETHQDVSDRTNDELRVDGKDIRAKVIGEGGNLGVTQLGRVEYALHGGLINTDALDNAAGVNTSDHEVNIKILLRSVQESGKLSEAKRNTVLENMTDDVAELVLEDNRSQARAISLKERQGNTGIDTVYRLQRSLTKRGLLDPKLEFLPNEEELTERRRMYDCGYTRPELSVLMAYAKAEIYDAILAGSLPDDPTLADTLRNYFPEAMHGFEKHMADHAVAREIIATVVTNDLVNHMGLTFLNRMRDETGHDTGTIAAAYLASSQLFRAHEWWDKLEALQTKVAAEVYFELLNMVKRQVEHGAFWLLRYGMHEMTIGEAVEKYQKTFNNLFASVRECLPKDKENRYKARSKKWQDRGLNKKTADACSLLRTMTAVPDMANLVNICNAKPEVVAHLYFALGDRLQISRLFNTIQDMPVNNNWERVASLTLLDELYAYQSQAVATILEHIGKDKPETLLATWLEEKKDGLVQYDERISELYEQASLNHAKLSVMLGQLKGLTF